MSDLYEGQVFGTGWRPLTRDDSFTTNQTSEKIQPKVTTIVTEQVHEHKEEPKIQYASKEDFQKINDKFDALVSGVSVFNGKFEAVVSGTATFSKTFEALILEISGVNENFKGLITNMVAINEKLNAIINHLESTKKPEEIEVQEQRGMFKIFKR